MADGSPFCSEPIFGLNCRVYNGSIGIWFGTYIHDIPPLVLKGHLSRLGLIGITDILQDLLLMMPADAGDAPPLVLSLFEDLTYIGGTLTMDVNSNGSEGLRISRQFALSSLQKVSHIGGNLNLRNTRLQDLSVFGALQCVGRALSNKSPAARWPSCTSTKCHTDGQIVLSENAQLLSYNGLQ
jgi:hypothetical protein